MPWFQLTGSNPTSPSNYTIVDLNSEPSCAGPKEIVCAIQALDDGNNNPVLDIAILSEIILALTAPGNTTNVLLKERPL